jgi:hypothetical protein
MENMATTNRTRTRGDRIVRRVTRTVAVAAMVASAALAGALGLHGKPTAAATTPTTTAPMQSDQPPVAQSGGS